MARVKENIITYGKSTSVKGVAKAVTSQKTFLRIMWLVAFVIGGATGRSSRFLERPECTL